MSYKSHICGLRSSQTKTKLKEISASPDQAVLVEIGKAQIFQIDVNPMELQILAKDNIIGFVFSGEIDFVCGTMTGMANFSKTVVFSVINTPMIMPTMDKRVSAFSILNMVSIYTGVGVEVLSNGRPIIV